MTATQVYVYNLYGNLEENALFKFLDGSHLVIVPHRSDSIIENLESALLYDRKGTLEAAVSQAQEAHNHIGLFWRNLKSSKMPYNLATCQRKLGEYLEAAVSTGKKIYTSYTLRVYNPEVWKRLSIDDRVEQCLKLWEIWKITSLTGTMLDYLKKGGLEACDKLPEWLNRLKKMP